MNTPTSAESVAKILIVDSDKYALILTVGEHRARPEKSFTPDLPGGMVEEGESEKEGAIRETLEEAGIILDPKDVYLVYANTEFYSREHKSTSKLLYTCRLDERPKVTFSWEHNEYEWVPLNKISVIQFRSFYKNAIEYAITHELL